VSRISSEHVETPLKDCLRFCKLIQSSIGAPPRSILQSINISTYLDFKPFASQHSTMSLPQGWSHNICSMSNCSSCCGAFWCGPRIYGRTAWRLKNYPNDPALSGGLDWLNRQCLGMFAGLVLAVPCIPDWLQRHAVRKRFDLRGSECADCLASVFCTCCSQVQHENELKDQAEKARLILSGPPSTQQPMVYAQQHAPLPQ
jgi:Cys-rich protein (TIGR01571 family)